MTAQKTKLIATLAEFLVADQAGKSVLLEAESRLSPDDPRPRLAHEWAGLRRAAGVQGYPTEEAVAAALTELLT